MGIQCLLPFLANSTRDAHISEFENEFVAIDAYCWLHKGIYSCAFELATKKPTVKYVTYCMRYIEMLLHFKVKPILVFDGRQLSSKSETEKKRREERKKKHERGKELLRAGNHHEGKKLLGESVDVTHELALNLIKQCREKNIDCIVAPYEADAQLAFFSLRNIVKCIITEDSDLLAYGSERVMFKMDTSGRGKLIEKGEIHFSLNMTPEEFNEDIFRYMCILSGCDYLPSLPSIGPANALKFIKMLKDSNIYDVLPKLPIYLNKRNVKVTPEYIMGFKIADDTFKHQLVYDPFLRSEVPLRPVKNDDDIVGTKLQNDLAFNLAVGNMDPMTMKKLDCYDPDMAASGFNLLWRTDLLSKATPRSSLVNFFHPLPEAKKRQRENLEPSSVQSFTNDLKKQRTPLNIKCYMNSNTKNRVRKIPDSGFIFDPKVSIEKKNIPDETKLLRSRYFSKAKDTDREKKETESANDRRKDESYEDYLQRLYNEYFPIGENESEQLETRKGYDCVQDTENTLPKMFCSLCRKDSTCCSCLNESADVSESQELRDFGKDNEELKKNNEESVVHHFLLDEIYKSQIEKSENLSKEKTDKKEEDEIPEKVSPSQSLSLNFSKILSKIAETPKTKTEIEKENSEVISVEEQEPYRSPSPVFKIQRDSKVLNRTCRLGNISDTTSTSTSVYFTPGRLNESTPVSSERTPSNRKMPSVRSFSSVPPKSGKNHVKSSSVNKTLFQFGFKKERRAESDLVA